jgi:hypothetical protein
VRDVRGVSVRGLRLGQVGVREQILRYLIRVKGECPGLRLEGLEFRLGPWTGALTLDDVVGSAEEPVRVVRCRVVGAIPTEGVMVAGAAQASSRPSRYIQIRENRITGVFRGIHLQGAVADVQVVGNLAAGCVQEGIGSQDPMPNGGRVLVANNTVFNSDCGLRGWCNPGHDLQAGQIEICNNLLLDNVTGDMVVYVGTSGGNGDVSQEKADAAVHRWRFGGNWRDFSGSAYLIPLGAGDHKLTAAVRLERNPSRVDFLRPHAKSKLATGGAGNADPSLPLYVGALPPEGGQAWDWDRTWPARVGKVKDKK